MNKYKIVYTEGESSDEMDLLSLLDKWCCTDGLGGCKYFKNKEEITLKEFTEDFYNEIEKQAKNKSDEKEDVIASSGYSAKVASSGDYAKVASSGDYAQVASSGYSAQVASSGDYAKVASSGDYAQVASSGYSAKVASSGYSAKVASSGDSAKVASSGYSAKVASSGYSAKVASSGDYAQVASSGYSAKVASSGDYAQVASSGYSAKVASSGDSAKVASSGYSAKVASSGYSAKVASSGDYAKHDIKGKDSVCFDCGIGGIIKGVKGTYIALCEWYWHTEEKQWKIRATATAQIDGKKLKENTYYGLYNGKFSEIDFTDNIKSAIIKTKGKVKQVKIIDTENNIITDKVSYIVADNNGNFAHGQTIKQAKESLLYKISNRDTSKYKNLTLESKLTFEEAIKMYRVITGACEFGTKHFIEENKINKDKKYTIKEIIELTKGQYGNQTLKEFFNKEQK